MPPGMKTKKASGLAAAILRQLGGEVELAQRRVDLVGDLAFEVLLEAADHVLAGLVVRRQQEGLLVALVLRVLAEHLGRLVVLVGGGEEDTGCSPCRRAATGRRWG